MRLLGCIWFHVKQIVHTHAASKFGATVADLPYDRCPGGTYGRAGASLDRKTVLADVELGPGPLSAFRRSGGSPCFSMRLLLLAQRAMVPRVAHLFW